MLKTMLKPTSDTYREGDAVHILMIVHSVETGKLCCIPFSNVINDRNDSSIYVSTNDVVKHEPKPRELQVGDHVRYKTAGGFKARIIGLAEGMAWLLELRGGDFVTVPVSRIEYLED